ncbi:hypothetical protein, partial [Arachidicoccus sp.]|uniref:hypothetical protein n=1 Tax=Arachidicoccus sp. TaxID=1872624 RepID=UPI003D20DA7B
MRKKDSIITGQKGYLHTWASRSIASLLIFSLVQGNVCAQTASVTLDRQQILLGEHLTLQLTVDNL